METTTLILSAVDGASAPQATQDATRPFRDAVERALRGKRSRWVALALHLTRLQTPGGPRAHHRRIARVVLDDAAARQEGQLFTLPNGDFVLLVSAADGGAGLAATLADLFAPDMPTPDRLLSRFLLPAHLGQLFSFLETIAAVAPAGPHQVDSGLSAIAALVREVEPGRIRDLLERQTGVLVAMSGENKLVPLFREIRFSLSALETRAGAPGAVTADPFLYRHLVSILGPAMLDAMIEDIQRADGLLSWARHGRPILHLDMGVDMVLSPRMAVLAKTLQAEKVRFAVELPIVEAYADAAAFMRARARLRELEFGLVLDEVDVQTLLLTRPAQWQPDLVKLNWSAQLPDAGEKVGAAIEAIGETKIVLQYADTEAAVRWGIAHGIRRFQGRHVDQILAASRIAACPEAAPCTMRRCIERENAATGAGRAGCGNLKLLDAASPSTLRHAA